MHKADNINLMDKIYNTAVEWKTLGEVCDIKAGQPISKQIIAENTGIYPVINSGKEPLGYFHQYNTENDPIGITSHGAGVGSITWQEGKYFRGALNYSVKIKNPEELHIRFFFHLLKSLENHIHSLGNFAGIPFVNASKLKSNQNPPPAPFQTTRNRRFS